MRRNDLKYHQGLKKEDDYDKSFMLDLTLVITAIVAVTFIVIIFEPEIRAMFGAN